jgi:hypothetical protein
MATQRARIMHRLFGTPEASNPAAANTLANQDSCSRLPFVLLGLLAALDAGCQPYYEVTVGTRIRAALDVSRFERVLVAGFVTSAKDPIDTNDETIRLLRSQLQTKTALRVAEAGALTIPSEHVQDAAFWKRVGEEHAHALIVTGSVSFTDRTETQVVRTNTGWSRSVPADGTTRSMAIIDQQRYTLEAVFVFIDGETGQTLFVRSFRLATMYDFGQSVPALSAYFDLMDRLVPKFLGIVNDQVFYGPRTLLK